VAVIELDGLTKRFGAVTAVEDLSLSVEQGEVFGFLGPNGAGKSTTINTMLDFIRPTAGRVRVFGHDATRNPVPIRERTGALVEGWDVYPKLTGREHLEHVADLRSADDDPGALLARVNLGGEGDRRAGTYSKGMAQRLAIAMALVGDPDLLVLDEPSTGLDPNGARRLRTIVREEADRGATVFFSSHILDEVEAVADRVAILRDGRLVTQGRVADLRAELGAATHLGITVDALANGLADRVAELDGVESVSAGDRRLSVTCQGGDAKLAVLRAVADSSADLVDFATEEPSLEEVFAAHTGGAEQ
jgi:ABC-2 type transport system ATP-binding protein